MSLKLNIVILFSLAFFSTSLAAFDQYETFEENGKYGLRNTETNEIVLEARYEAVGWSDKSFQVVENTIGVRQNEKWALASLNGDRITQHTYTVLYPFTEDLFIAAVRSKSSILDKLGVISARGREIISLEYDLLTPLNDRLIAGSLINKEYIFGLLSKHGREIIPQKYSSISPVEKNILNVGNTAGVSAIFNMEGDQLSPFKFEDIRPHNEQYLLVTFYNHQALVDKSGKVITPSIYKEIKLDKEGNSIGLPFRKWALFDNNHGQEKLLYFDKIAPLSSTLLAIQSGDFVGVIDKDETYKTYIPGLKLIGVYYDLLLVKNEQYQGVMNTKGQMILPLNYDSIDIKERMIFGQIRRRDKQDWQVYSHRGTLQSNQKYESYNQVTEYITYARRNGKSGLLDGRGKEASPFFYDVIGPLQGNKMVVKYQGNEGIINDRGNWVITPYKDSLAIYDRYALYRQGSEWGTLDFDEETLYTGQKQLSPLGGSLIATKDEDGYQLINYKGSLLRDEHYDSIYLVGKDLIALQKRNSTSLFRPSDFRLSKTPINTEEIGRLTDGMIATKIDGQWGFINELGQLRIANRYEAVNDFSEGLAAVKLIGKWGVIDKNEDIIVQPVYEHIAPFKNGLTTASQNGKWGLIDRKGRLILDLKYEAIERFENYIILKADGKLGLADARGNITRTPQFDSIKAIDNNLFIVTSRGKSGVISLTGEDKVAVAFEQVIPFGDYFLASEPSEWTMIPDK